MKFDPDKPAAEMTAAELMAAHVAMADSAFSGSGVVKMVRDIYSELNRAMGDCKTCNGTGNTDEGPGRHLAPCPDCSEDIQGQDIRGHSHG